MELLAIKSITGGGGSTSGILVGSIKSGGSFPTKRPDGSPLVAEDYVRPVAPFPFTVGSITFSSVRDKAYWTGSEWVLDPGVLQNTSETPVTNKSTESISGTATTQYAINNENKTEINKKLDKVDSTTANDQLYEKLADGTQSMIDVSEIVKVDDTTIQKNSSGKLEVKDNSITKQKIASSANVVYKDDVQTLTNKTIDATNNTISNLETSNFKSNAISTNIPDSGSVNTKLTTEKAVADKLEDFLKKTDVDGSTIDLTSGSKLEVKDKGISQTKVDDDFFKDNALTGDTTAENITITTNATVEHIEITDGTVGGTLEVPTPTTNNMAANKSYVDDKTKKFPYNNIKQLDDYLFEVEYSPNNIDYDYANTYFRSIDATELPSGSCSEILKDGKILRHLDWTYDNVVEFIVNTPADDDKGTLGSRAMCAGVIGMTKDFVESVVYSDKYKMIPFILTDGINDAGLYIGHNVVPELPTGGYDLNNTSTTECCVSMAIRYVLDHCHSISEVKTFFDTINIYSSNALTYGSHFLVVQGTDWAIIELNHDSYNVIDSTNNPYPMMTNFRNDGIAGAGLTYDENGYIEWESIEDYGIGVERYNLMTKAILEDESLESLRSKLMYTQTYTLTENKWSTEFCGMTAESDPTHKLTVMDAQSQPELFNPIFTREQQNYLNRTRADGKGTWQSTHAAIYDLSNKSMNLVIQERENKPRIVYYKQLEVSVSTQQVTGAANAKSITVNNIPYNLPTGGSGSVEIDEKTITKNTSGELQTAIGGWSESGVEIINTSYNAIGGINEFVFPDNTSRVLLENEQFHLEATTPYGSAETTVIVTAKGPDKYLTFENWEHIPFTIFLDSPASKNIKLKSKDGTNLMDGEYSAIIGSSAIYHSIDMRYMATDSTLGLDTNSKMGVKDGSLSVGKMKSDAISTEIAESSTASNTKITTEQAVRVELDKKISLLYDETKADIDLLVRTDSEGNIEFYELPTPPTIDFTVTPTTITEGVMSNVTATITATPGSSEVASIELSNETEVIATWTEALEETKYELIPNVHSTTTYTTTVTCQDGNSYTANATVTAVPASVDAYFGLNETLITIPDVTSKSYVGDVEDLQLVDQVVYKYPASFGTLTSVMVCGDECLSMFTKTEEAIGTHLYYVYTSTAGVAGNFTFIFN